jgi:predicted GIY-YIG superfamily endonuclease
MANENLDEIWSVYKITHTPTGRSYFGCTCRPEVRMKEHARKPTAPKLHQALNEYAGAEFSFEIVLTLGSRKEAHRREAELIREHNSIWPNGFNLHKGGRGSLAENLPIEVRTRLSENSKRSNSSDEVRERQRSAMLLAWQGEKGEKRRQSQRMRFADPAFRANALRGLEATRGRIVTDEDKRTMSVAQQKRYARERAEGFRKPKAEKQPRSRSPISAEQRAKLSAAHVALWHDEQFRAKQMERLSSAEARAAISAGQTGRSLTEQQRQKISATVTKIWEQRRIDAGGEFHFSDDVRKRMSESQKKAWAVRRQRDSS